MKEPVRRRVVAGIALASALVVLAATAAFAWNATCSASGDACVLRHGNFGVPLAAQTASDNTYTNDEFPNTQTTLNDQVSSIRNKFDVKDVVWFFNADWEGTSFCLDHESSAGVLNAHNDAYSSHLVAVGSKC